MHVKANIWLMIFLGVLLCCPPASSGSEKQSSRPSTSVTLEQIAALRNSLEGSQNIAEQNKKNALGMLDQAKRFQEMAASYAVQAADADETVKDAPERIQEIEAALKVTPPAPQEALRQAGVSSMTIERVEQALRQAEVALSDAQAAYSNWRERQSQHALLAQKLRDGRVQANKRLDEIRRELAAQPAQDEDALVVRIKRLLLLAEQNKCRAELSLFEKQLVGYDVIGALAVAERDFAAREVATQEGIVTAWQDFAQSMRKQAAVQAREDAIRAMVEKSERLPVLKAQYDANIELGTQLESIIKDDAEIARQLQTHKQRLAALEDVFKLAREWVDQDILSESVSLIIHEQGNSLPSIFMFRRRTEQRQDKLVQIRDGRLLIERKKRELSNFDDAVDAVLASLDIESPYEQDVLRRELRIVLYDRREILNKLDEAYGRLFKTINAFAFTDRQLMERASEFKLFLARHLLWIRSDKPIGLRDIDYLRGALAWLFSPQNWRGVYRDFISALRGAPFLWAFCLFMSGLAFVGRRRSRTELVRTSRLVNTFETDSFALTVRACIATVVLAAAWPLVLYAAAGILAGMTEVESFTNSVCASLKRVALLMGLYNCLYYICHKHGLAAVHCRWSETSRAVIKNNLAWFLAVFWPFTFFFILTEVYNNESFEASLGRFSFIILLLLLTVLFARVFGLHKGIAASKLRLAPESWLARLRYLWYGAAVSVPLVFAGLAFNGYFYTALMLMRRTGFSIWVLFIAVLVNDILLRWLLLARRRLALEQKKERSVGGQEAQARQDGHPVASDFSDEAGNVPVEEKHVDLVQVDEQTHGLLRIIIFFATVASLWAIWAQLLPALDLLDDIALWSYRETVGGVVQLIPITLGNLMWAIVLTVVAFVAARNLPGVLDITLFSRFSLDEGVKYALVTICRYIVVVIGIIVVVNSIGFRWESLQWLIAALGVGLGFGLQEIVANFISGLIILFERPFRLGDVVTSGDVTGKVTRIQIRATTITDWDRHELIVPNKEFITGRLINWTLSDPVVRVIVPVGVAYGSDTALVEQLLMKVAAETDIVLDEPEPRALFLGFGDSSLNFELRVFISGVTTLATKHRLHMAIDHEFRKAGITISFPQRDVHVDSLGPIDVRVVPGKKSEKGTTD